MLGHRGEKCIEQERISLYLVTARSWRWKRFLSNTETEILDNFIQDWNATIRDEDRYFPYRHVKFIFEPEQYLSVLEIYCFKVGLCQLRLGVLPVNNSLDRYSVFASCRNCVLCVNEVEDEEHLLFTCPLYTDFRVKFPSDTSQNATTASLLNVLALKNKTNMLRSAKFVSSAMKRRKKFTGSG